MGLALARQLARRTGGDLIVGDPGGAGAAADNTLGGAVFVARLPGIVAPAGPA
jgi:two-component system CitB family sensor kinase